MSLRTVGEDDWAEWRQVRLAALAEAPYAFSSTLAGWSGPSDSEDRWRQRLRDVPFNVLAALAGRPVGMVSATSPTDGEAELISLWVAPEARGRGVADALIGAVVERASSWGCERVALGVREANRPAVSAYQRNGFVDAGPRLETEGHPERRMVLTLGGGAGQIGCRPEARPG